MRYPQFRLGWSRVHATLLGVAVGSVAFAQTASQITPPTFRPSLPRVEGSVVFSGEPGLAAPPGAERLFVTISGVTVEGGFPELSTAEAALVARLTGGPVPVSEIFAAAQDLEAAYAQAGYVLVRVVLPAQNLSDGDRLRLVVVDGFIERIDTEGVPERIRGRITAVTNPLIGLRHLTLAEIERRLLIAGDSYGVALRSALSAGDQAGGAVLIVDARFREITGFVALDNTLSDALGTWTLSAGFEANSLLGLGETWYFRASGYPGGDFADGLGAFIGDNPRSRTIAAGAVFPIGNDGLEFNIEGTASQTTPDFSDEFNTGSNFQRLALRLDYPWIRSRELNVNFQTAFDFQSEEQYLIADGGDQPFSKDRLRILRFSGDAAWQLESGALVTGGAIASFGLDAFGARGVEDTTPELPLSRQGADADFQKLEVVATYAQTLRDHLGFSLYARGQTSFGQALAKSEQIGVASFRELSTFDAGSIGGDEGWIVRGNILSPWGFETARAPLLVTPYAFAATSSLRLFDPTIFEVSRLQASSVGIGVELNAIWDPDFSQASVTLEYGRGYRDDGLPDENRATLVASYQF